MTTNEEITQHLDPDPNENPWVDGPPPTTTVQIVRYDPDWPTRYATLAARIKDKLGPVVLHIEHIGSTSVPGLAAKDVIDIDIIVADPRNEDLYISALTDIGYVHSIRQLSFYEHRALVLRQPRVNLHVYGPDCPEHIRHRMFRDWLIDHAEDREFYENAKRAAIPGGGNVMDYNRRKQNAIRTIYDRMFRAAGML